MLWWLYHSGRHRIVRSPVPAVRGRRADMYISTLRSYIEAMGGHLEIVATFPDGAVRLTQLGEGRAAGENPSTEP